MRWPWSKAPDAGASLAGGAMGGLSGISGDVAGAEDLARRRWEQSFLDAGWWSGGLPGMFAPFVSEWMARGVPALTAGMRLISGVVMQLPLRQKRGDLVLDPPAPIISNPTPGANRCLADFVDEYVSDILLYGNYAAVLGPLDSSGWPAYLIPLDITQVSVARDPVTWRPVYALEGVDELLPDDRVFHVGIDKRSGELAGRGVLPTLAGAISSALAADAYAGRYFTESAVPSGVITDTRPNLTQEQADDLKSKWMAAVSGTRSPVVVPGSTTFTPLATDADKAQLVQARQWDATMVAMILGVPPFLLGIETQRHTYTNAETEFGRFVSTTILRILRPLEQQLTAQCLPRGNSAEFWTGALLRADTATRTNAAVALYAAEIISVEEARSLAGFPAAGGPMLAGAHPGGEAPVSAGTLPASDAAPADAGDAADSEAAAALHLVVGR
jgi:HK97 family phage portal protein